MSFVDTLRELRVGKHVSKLEFLQGLEKGRPAIHVFYEGKTDNGFYLTMLKRKLNKEKRLRTYVCGNKKEVYKTRASLRNRDYEDTLLFFADKDIDNIIPIEYPSHSDIHVTETYSVENYLVNQELFGQVSSELMKINVGDKQLEKIIDKYSDSENQFCDLMKIIMAWVLCSRRMGVRPNLNNVKLSEIINIDENLDVSFNCSLQDLYSYLSEKSKANIHFLSDFLLDSRNEIDNHAGECIIRGKYHLWFFINFFDSAKLALEKANNCKIKVSSNLSEKTAIELLSPRIYPPQTVLDFIEKNCAPDDLIQEAS